MALLFKQQCLDFKIIFLILPVENRQTSNYTNCLCTYKSYAIRMCFARLKWHTQNKKTDFKILKFCSFASQLTPKSIDKKLRTSYILFLNSEYQLVKKQNQCLLWTLDKYIMRKKFSFFHLKSSKE